MWSCLLSRRMSIAYVSYAKKTVSCPIVLCSPVPEAPTTIRQKETPFLVARRRDAMLVVGLYGMCDYSAQW